MAELESIKKIIQSRQFTQDKIIRLFGPEKLDAKRVELCTNCRWRIDLETGPPFCEHSLFPLTLTGDNCSYCDPKPPETHLDTCEYALTCKEDPQRLDYCPRPNICKIS